MEEGAVGLDSRVARIESDVANIGEAVVRIDKRMDRLDEKIDGRFDRIDERFAKVDENFAKLDGKVNDLDKRMAVMERGFTDLSANQVNLHIDLRQLRSSLDTKFVWIVTTMIAFGMALLAAMAKGFHWLK